MSLPENFKETVIFITKKISNEKINWAFTGSTNFNLQGIDLTPHDIDIQTDEGGAYKIQEIFKNYIIEKVHLRESPNVISHFGRLLIHNIVVEIMGDMKKKLENGQWQESINLYSFKRFVKLNNILIPVLDLKYEAEAYKIMGRLEKAKIIEERIKSLKK